MKISKRPPTVSGDKRISGTQGARVSKLTKAAAKGNVDKLQVTASTTQLRELEAELSTLDITDTAKIEAVRLAIDSGSFAVDSEVVADRLIDTAKESVRKRPRK